MYYVYILRNKDGTSYTGFTRNVRDRLARHLRGSTKTTSDHVPARVEFVAGFRSKQLALDFEKYLKTPSGYAFRNKRLIAAV